MTQKHIRKNAGFPWWKRAYYKLREPRHLSAIYGTAYFLIALVWIRAIFVQPQTFEGPFGPVAIGIIGTVISTGAIASLVTVANGAYWAERSTAAIIVVGMIAYFILTVYMEIVGGGNRQPGALSTLLGTGFLLLRYWWILDRPHSPDKHFTD